MTEPASPPAAPDLVLEIELDRRINFALQQNDVPVVKSVRIENRGAGDLEGLELELAAEPAFARPWSRELGRLAAGQVLRIDAVDLDLVPAFLGSLTERVKGELRLLVRHGEETLAERVEPVELLAREEWSGTASLPEILAAFVQPNHPAVEGLLRDAAALLAEWSADPSLDGYQSQDRQRVYRMAGAVYGAIQARGLTYVSPPASFEEQGQRVRLPDHVLASGMATCLDVSLLAAACLEQAGLHPLVVLVEGHAFVGVWLQQECFHEPVVLEPLRLRKRVDLDEIAVFDPTGALARPAEEFARSVERARGHLDDPERFQCLVDVQRARRGRIRPLPARVDLPEEPASGAPSAGPVQEPDATRIAPAATVPVEVEETPETRLDRWRRKLLDLSLRNRLLNFRESRKTLPLACPDVALLEDLLAGGTALRLVARPEDLGERDPRDAGAHSRRTGEDGREELLLEELKAGRLAAEVDDEELVRRATELYRAARLGLEEGGASNLYLAIGFLQWFESPSSEQPRLAPLLLVPVQLERSATRQEFRLRLGADETRVNVTLLEALRTEHGIEIAGLDPLPEDESGIDVPLLLRTVRQAIRDVDRWDVLERVALGLFSFTKFLMWRDLSERAGDLLRNPVVEHLVHRPREAFDPGAPLPAPERLDEERTPAETYCPLPADSSQLAAVFAAAEGRSFVIEGPPGTGKSQTITNLIAHCLAEGKSVLFVSEKMAALNVVARRLQAVGLGRFCLELHSARASKREVLAQLGEALERHGERSVPEWQRESARLAEVRAELNAYVRALHRVRPSGESVFRATSRLIGLEGQPRVDPGWSDPDAITAERLVELRDLVQRLATAAGACGEVPGHVWSHARCQEWTPDWLARVEARLAALEEATRRLDGVLPAVLEPLSLADLRPSLEGLRLVDELGRLLAGAPAATVAVVVAPGWDGIQQELERWIAHGRRRDELRAGLGERFGDELLRLDLEQLEARRRKAAGTFWPASWLGLRGVRKALARAARDGRAPRVEELESLLARALELRSEQQALDAAGERARELLGGLWNGGDAAWDGVEELRGWAGRLRALALRLAGTDLQRAAALREAWARLALEGRELLRDGGALARPLAEFQAALATWLAARSEAVEVLDLDEQSALGDEQAPGCLETLGARLQAWRPATRELRGWCAWRRARADALRADLGRLVDAYEAGEFPSAELGVAFDHGYTRWWVGRVTERDLALKAFYSPEHERKIALFQELDERHLALTRDLVQARLAERIPAATQSSLPNSEVGILQHELGKKRRHLSVRRLFERIPNLLPRMKPCLLMSPMSVAQYLAPDYPPFDLVVFDEASQIPIWDAVGALARGRQAVIVGDPRQLPPTSFFQKAEDDEEPEEEIVEDLESILDDCIGARLPWLPLDWHYRSRHESLIAFSNHHYYGGRLLTFPSPDLEGMGVAWRHVSEGVYDKGRTRTNRAEAEAVVAEVLERLRDPRRSGHSIGVVTFNQAQQTLIEDLLDRARAEEPELEPFFSADAREPVFVKNLENVQGDERDVILFSITYGPDLHGKVSVNFGPMNREGGERRLNVAITRSRREVVVFSTLRGEDIDLARTRSRGVRDLKWFLEYAQRGPAALAEAVEPGHDADFDSPFEQEVHRALTARGWQVHKQVGCASYRIDLAVVDPRAPGRYLLGIECDGAMYHSARTARDRDKVREAVLRGLGWELERIWSTDWWTDARGVLERLEARLEELRSGDLEPREDALATEPPSESGASTADGTQAPAGEAAGERAGDDSEGAGATDVGTSALGGVEDASEPTSEAPPLAVESSPASDTETPEQAAADEDEPLRYASATASLEREDASAAQAEEHYVPFEPPLAGAPDDLHDPSRTDAIAALFVRVVEEEGPLGLEPALRRVAQAFDVSRLTARVRERLLEVLGAAPVQRRADPDAEFLWPRESEPEAWTRVRVPAPDGSGERSAEELPLEEIAAAALELLRGHLAAPVEDVVRESARRFGIRRVGSNVDARFRLALDLLERRGALRRDGDQVVLVD